MNRTNDPKRLDSMTPRDAATAWRLATWQAFETVAPWLVAFWQPARSANRAARQRHSLEQLESRVLLHSTGFVGNSAHLTLSFAPDGTNVAGHASELFAQFDQVAERSRWQNAILDGFQTWAVHTNADIGLVHDGGLPLGTPGPARRDTRFGDIRIAAAPLAADVLAISIPERSVVSGSWVGDVIFNSEASFANVDEIFSVAVHEAGHVFGLGHSEDPLSPMHIHGISPAVVPTAHDIDDLQEAFGQRVADVNESLADEPTNSSNDGMQQATRLEPVRSGDSLEGSAPSIALGDLTHDRDRDFYEVIVPAGYEGRMTFRVRTRAISLLDARVTLMNAKGQALAIDRTRPALHMDDTAISIMRRASESESIYVRIDAANSDELRAIGGYALIVSFDDRITVASQRIDAVTTPDYRIVSARQLKSLFETSNDPLRNYDHFTNDSFDDATQLFPSTGFPVGQRYEAYGEISFLDDVDIFSIQSPQRAPGALVVSVRSRDPERLIPDLYVYDEQREWRPASTLINGGGQVVVQVDQYEPTREYLIAVRAAKHSSPESVPGRYHLTVDFAATPVDLSTFVSGRLTANVPRQAQLLHVAKPQLFHLIAESKTNVVAPSVWSVTLSSNQYRMVVFGGESRSSGSVLLQPGSYTVDVRMETPLAEGQHLDFQLNGVVVSDTFGVIPIDPADEPDFRCEANLGMFCFPNQIVTPSPFAFEGFLPFDWDEPIIFDVQETIDDWWNWSGGTSFDAPRAHGDQYETTPGNALSITSASGVLANDADPNQDLIAARVIAGPSHGELELDLNGGFRYRPNPGFAGVDLFQYLAIDSTGLATPAVAMIDVRQSLGDRPGDASRDGIFNSVDLVLAFQAGEYEDGRPGNSTWETGDWNGDGEFDSSDLVYAFQSGGYQA